MSHAHAGGISVANQLVPLQAQVLEDITVSKPLNEILNHICLLSEDLVNNCVASIMILDKGAHHMTVVAAPSLPQDAIEAFDGIVPLAGNGSCANAVMNQQPTFVNDVSSDERWDNVREAAKRFNIEACWSSPIYENGVVSGSFAITSFEKRQPDALQQQLLKTSAHLAGIAIEKDNTERYRRYSEIAFKNASVGIIVADERARVFRSNVTFSHMTGVDIEDMIGTDLFSLLLTDEKRYAFVEKVISKQKIWCGEMNIASRVLGEFPALVNIGAVVSDDGRIEQYVAEISDISLLKESQNKLQHLAHHDQLTNLANRYAFESYLKQSLLNNEQKAVLFIDLDNFKTINDTRGHDVGDVLLKQVAERLTDCVRGDDIVARLGGDEFIMLIAYKDSLDVERLAKRIKQKMGEPFVIKKREYFSSASIGIALAPDDGDSVGVLIKNADVAMYRAKHMGKNQYSFYNRKVSHKLKPQLQMEKGLCNAISNNELHIVYQPIIDIEQKVVGAEALLRWQSNEHGAVSPADFIPVAEESGLIIKIGRWVLSNACQQAKQWHEEGRNIPISVNVSPHQLIDSFEVELSNILSDTGLDPECLELEFTESTILKHIEENNSLLRRINQLGVKIAIDDFGIGYSSLSDLKNMPVQTLKIDQSLVRDLADDKDDEAITRAVVAMGTALGLEVIAEGVETAEQLTMLQSAGCQHFQGYLLGKPVACDVFLSRMDYRIS